MNESARDEAGVGAFPDAATSTPPTVEDLLVRYLPRLRAFVRLRVGGALRQRESCSDVVQSVCRELLQGADRFTWQGEVRFRAWLFQAARNKVLERQRMLMRQKHDVRREVECGSEDAYADARMALQSPSQVAIAREFASEMAAAFELLPEDYREVIALARIAGLPHAEVARQMGRGVGAVRMLLSRALVAYVAAMDRVRGRR